MESQQMSASKIALESTSPPVDVTKDIASRLVTLPAELAEHIASCLPDPDLRNLRLCCKALAENTHDAYATRKFEKIIVKTTPYAFASTFKSLEQNDAFGKVRSIIIRDTSHQRRGHRQGRNGKSLYDGQRLLEPRITSEMQRLLDGLQNLRVIKLNGAWYKPSFETTVSKAFLSTLSAARTRHLEKLDICCIDLNVVQFIECLDRHKHSLKSLKMLGVSLSEGSWEEIFCFLRGHVSLCNLSLAHIRGRRYWEALDTDNRSTLPVQSPLWDPFLRFWQQRYYVELSGAEDVRKHLDRLIGYDW